MANIRKEITQYEVSTAIRRSGTPVTTSFERIIILKAATESGGLNTTVTMAFATSFSDLAIAVVGYFSGPTTLNHRISIWMPVSEFQTYYDILRNENPVSFELEYNTANPLINYVTNFKLTTGLEPTGEGPESLAARTLFELKTADTE
jgi:hypothetical protein